MARWVPLCKWSPSRALALLGVVDNVELLGHGTSPAPANDFSMHAFVRQLHERVHAIVELVRSVLDSERRDV